MRRSKQALVGSALCLLVVAVAVCGPWFAPFSPTETVGGPFAAPSATFPFGTDYLGRDVLSRLLYGGGSLILLALAATAVGATIGVLAGMTAGLANRLGDGAIMRTLDALLAFPPVIFALVVVSIAGPSPLLLIFAVALIHVPRVARIARGVTVHVREEDYVLAARLRGEKTFAIIRREIFPAIARTIWTDVGLRFAGSVLILASLNYLGVGLQPPSSDWGLTVNENLTGLFAQPLAVLAPAAAIALLTVGVNLLIDGLLRSTGGTSARADRVVVAREAA